MQKLLNIPKNPKNPDFKGSIQVNRKFILSKFFYIPDVRRNDNLHFYIFCLNIVQFHTRSKDVATF